MDLDKQADQIAVVMKQAVRGMRTEENMRKVIAEMIEKFCEECEFEETAE